jgi:hypothetical protein
MCNERALRRPDFLPGLPIRLADGQCWTFPVPRASSGSPERVAPGELLGLFGDGYAPTLAAVLEAEDESERLRAELALAIFLLGRNYDLSPAVFREILSFRPGDAALVEMQRAFHEVAVEHSCQFPEARARVPETVTRAMLDSTSQAEEFGRPTRTLDGRRVLSAVHPNPSAGIFPQG